jgi:hypothetical protein
MSMTIILIRRMLMREMIHMGFMRKDLYQVLMV